MGLGLCLLVVVLGADQAPPPPPPPSPESPDYDAAPPPPPPPGICVPACRRGFRCQSGACVADEPPPPGPAPITPAVPDVPPPPPTPPDQPPGPVPIPLTPQVATRPPPRPREPEVEKSVVAMHLNLADLFMHGLTGAFDWIILYDLKIGIFVEARAMNAGILSYFDVWPFGPQRFYGFSNTYTESLNTGFGAALGVEKFFGDSPGIRGPYLAAGVEFLERNAALHGNGWSYGEVVEWFAVPHARGGLRLRGGSFLFGIGARAGAGIMVSSVFNSNGQSTNWGSSRRIFFDGAVILDLGFYLK